MYRVIEYFTDLQDDDHEYRTGDIFPREGLKVSEARLAELASAENLRGIPLIELVEPEKVPLDRIQDAFAAASVPGKYRVSVLLNE